MATGASSSRMQLSYIAEGAAFGVLKTGSNLQVLRYTSESLRQESDSQVSAEIRSDRQVADVVRTRLRALGDVNLELNYGDYDDLIAAALQSVNTRATGSLGMATKPTDTADTVTIGTTVYRFMDTPAQAYDVEIGSLVADSQANLVAAINGSGTPGVEYFAGTVAHPDVRAVAFAANVMVVTAKQAGLDANSIATTETFTDVTDKWVAATLLGGTGWAASVTIGPAITLSTSDADNSFNDSGSGFGSIVANQWIKVSGFTTAANNGYFKVVSVAAGKLVVTGGTLVTEIAGDSVTITMGAYITNGTTLTSYNIEKQFADLTTTFAILTGMCVDTLALNIVADAIITGAFGFIGKDSQSAAASSGTGYDAVGTNDVMSAIDDVTSILENDASYDTTALSLNLRNNLRERIQVGALGTLELGVGTLNISGTLQAYFATSTVMDKFLDFTSSSISVVVEDADGNGYVIDLPKVKYTSGQRVAGGQNQDIIADMAFEAYREPVENVTIRIARFPA